MPSDLGQQAPQPDDAGTGLIAGLAGLAKNLLGLVMNRIELAALELSEVRTNLVKFLVVFALGAITAWFAVAYWTVLIVYLGWRSLGWTILLIMAVMFTMLTFVVFLYARRMLREGKLSMPATMSELRNDRNALLTPEPPHE